MQQLNYVIDPKEFQMALERAGYRSIQQLAQQLSIHRNTIHHFLSGASVFPESIGKIFSALDIEPMAILKKKAQGYDVSLITGLVDALFEKRRNMCVVLFGSRARQTNSRFSDFDLGIYAREGLSHTEYLDLISCRDDNVEDLPVTVDLVNLCRADKDFIENIVGDLKFLGGRLSDWLELKGKADGQKAGTGNS